MWIYEMLHKDFRKLGNFKEIPEMLGIEKANLEQNREIQ